MKLCGLRAIILGNIIMRKSVSNFVMLCLILLSAKLAYAKYVDIGSVMVASLSTDGRYVVTSHRNRAIVLWDILEKRKKIISRHGNIYSAYFIKHSDHFMWQDLNNVVHIQDISGKVIKSFASFPSYGHLSNHHENNYFVSDDKWNLYQRREHHLKKSANSYRSFPGSAKLLNLTISDNEKYLVSSGSCGKKFEDIPVDQPQGKKNLTCVVLWDFASGQPLFKFSGNSSKTYATISPYGQSIIAGSENGIGFVWETNTGKQVFRLADIQFGRLQKQDWDYKNPVPLPSYFKDQTHYYHNAILALKFIDLKGHYLRFTTYVPYVILYDIKNDRPRKYLPLGQDPWPSINSYLRDAAIDTSPETHRLVTGQQHGNGINVYQYHPEDQSLELIWIGK